MGGKVLQLCGLTTSLSYLVVNDSIDWKMFGIAIILRVSSILFQRLANLLVFLGIQIIVNLEFIKTHPCCIRTENPAHFAQNGPPHFFKEGWNISILTTERVCERRFLFLYFQTGRVSQCKIRAPQSGHYSFWKFKTALLKKMYQLRTGFKWAACTLFKELI